MITQLRAVNFKSWKDFKSLNDTGNLSLAPLTGLFGPNSSGKTSILQMLLVLKQTAESADRKQVLHTGDRNSLVDLGTFTNLLHNHEDSAELSFGLGWDLPTPLTIKSPETQATLYNIKRLWFETHISEEQTEQRRPSVNSFAYHFDDRAFGMQRMPDPERRLKYELIHHGYPARRLTGRAWPLPSPVKCYGFPDEAVGYYQNTGFLPDLTLALEGLFSRVFYLGPLREYPQRQYVWSGESPIDVGRRGDKVVPALLAAQSEGRTFSSGRGRSYRSWSFRERIAQWLKEMGLIDSFRLETIATGRKEYEVLVKTTPVSSEVLITDVGFGVSQILPVLVLCYYAPEHSTIILEQPEIHLHPSVQALLAEVFVDVVKKRKVQIIVESHSEHLLRRLQRLIAEKKIKAEQAALYFCRFAGQASRIDELDVDKYGSIRNWPKGFFGDEMGDLAAMTEAAMKRQMAGEE